VAFRILDLFAGAGGAALGAHLAGAEHAALIEYDAWAARAATAAGWPMRLGDVRDLRLYDRLGAVDAVWGSPPCQAWSVAHQHEGPKGADDTERNGWPWYLDVVRRIRPRWCMAENVKGALPYVTATVIPALRALYPAVAVWTLNARDYGVPQSRTRIFVVAGPVAISQPRPTHVPPEQAAILGLPRWRTMRDALGVPYDRPSPAVLTNEYKGRPLDPKWWAKLNNASDALAIATNGARKRLDVSECAILQTFPLDYPFGGTVEARYRQVGNAVPPRLARVIVAAVMDADLSLPRPA